jgi:FixJ family two-component response regulator
MRMSSPIIHIVDDDSSFRLATGELLRALGYRVGLYESAKALLEKPPLEEPSCILLDVQMAELSGPELQHKLVALGCTTPIVFVSGHADIPTTVQAIKAGAEDFLIKPLLKERLLEAIDRAIAQSRKMHNRSQEMVILRTLFTQLTPRERQVFDLLVRGKPHKQIAVALGTTERTVKLHRHNVMQKFRIRSLAELAVIAERLEIIDEIRYASV